MPSPNERTSDGLEDLPELSYGGIPTFLKADRADPDALTGDVDVGVVGIPFDGGATRQQGARFGPAAIRRATGVYAYYTEYKGELVNAETGQSVDHAALTVRDCGDAPVAPNDAVRTRDHVIPYVKAVAERTFPVVLGGDHYLTYPSFRGVSEAYGEDVGVVQIDAHSDTTDGSTLHGEHYHASPMARIHESEHGGYRNHAMVGIRGYEEGRVQDLPDDEGLLIKTMSDVRDEGVERCVTKAIEHVTDGVDHVYLTVDIDAVDPAFASGTGTPEPGGMTSNELIRAVSRLGECDAIRALDLMEVAPNLDPTGVTRRIGAKAIMQFLERRFL